MRVNHPLDMAGDRIYLMGNGYAPTITIRDADGDVVYSESGAVPAAGQEHDLARRDQGARRLPEQLGLVGFFYPTQAPLASGAFSSAYPALVNPVVSLDVYAGDLGIDDGTPRSVYTLDPTGMTAAHRRRDGRRPHRAVPGPDAGSARRLRHDHVRERGARRRRRLRRIGQAVRLAVDPPGCRGPLDPRVRRARDRRTARGAVRAAAPHLGQGDAPGPHAPGRVRGPRARRGPDAGRRRRPVRAASWRRPRGLLLGARPAR